MVGRITRRITTLVLIAALVPAPGLAWDVPVSRRPGAASTAEARAFAHALNSLDQGPAGAARPQVYLVFNVDLAVQTPGPPNPITASSVGWFDQFLKELMSQPVTPVATATGPPDSILDQIDAGNAHVLSLPTATGLAAMPDTLGFEANPNESVPVERSMSVALNDALHEAGIDTNNGSTTFKRGTGTVTYEGENTDGDIVVTGRLVNGQIVLTKEFKPLTGGGNVGAPVQIRRTGTATNSGTSVTGTQNTSTQNTGAQAAAVSAPAPTPLVSAPSAYNRALASELETKARTITPNAASSALMGQINIRDTHVAQMNNMATGFENLLKNPAQLDIVVSGLRRGAEAVDNAYQNMLGAERAVAEFQGRNPRADLKGAYDADMRRAAQLEANGNAAGAQEIRTQAGNTAYGHYVQRRQAFYQALDQNPLLGLGERNLLMPDDFLFKKLRNTLPFNAPNSDYVSLARPYFERAATEAREESTRAAAIKTPEGFMEFGGSKYDRTREAMNAEGQANGSDLPRQLGEAAQGLYEQVEGAQAIKTEVTNFGLNLIAGTAWVLPFIGPFISAGAAAIQVVREGDDLVVAVLDAEDARNLAGVTGYTRVITAEDRVAAERGEFVLSVAGLALEGLQGIKVVKGPRPAATGNAATDATATATRNAPSPAAASAPSSTPRTNAPVREAGSDPLARTGAIGDKTQVFPEAPSRGGRVESPGRRLTTAELADADAAELAELAEVYDANLAYARASGVSADRIRDITAGVQRGDPDVANLLYREALEAQGKQLDMPLDESGESSFSRRGTNSGP